MTVKTRRQVRKEMRLSIEEAHLRQTLWNRVDEVFAAYVKTFQTPDMYHTVHWFWGALFRAVNMLPPDSDERIGALKAIDYFALSVLAEYDEKQRSNEGKLNHAVRKP